LTHDEVNNELVSFSAARVVTMLHRVVIAIGAVASCISLPVALGQTTGGNPATDVERATAEILTVYDRKSALLIGELHGTVETPAIVVALVARLVDEGPVTLALEIPRQEQVRLDRYLASDGSSSAVNDLLAGAFWQRPPHQSDGRQSVAMLGLIEAVRARVLEGKHITLVALDDETFTDRRDGMAAGLSSLAPQLERGAVIALLGNVHARLAPFEGISNGQVIDLPLPTASRVSALPITSINVYACQGAFWACTGGCGRIELPACPGSPNAGISPLDPAQSGYHFIVWLPKLTPSAPAARIE
jgi:hypothetical protein